MAHCTLYWKWNGIKVFQILSHFSTHFKVWAVKNLLYVSHKAGGEFGCCPVTWKPTLLVPTPADGISGKDGFMQSTSSELDSPAHIWIIYSHTRCLNKGSLFIPGDTRFHGLFVGFWVLLYISQLSWNSPAVSGGAGAIFLALNHSIPSAWWSLLINHITMFHNLGITASMSLITICALLEPKGSQTLWLWGRKH